MKQWFIAVLLLVGLLSACNPNQPSGGSKGTPISAATGGTIEVGGAKLTIPAPAQFLEQMIFPANQESTRVVYATDEELCQERPQLEAALKARLPALMAEFKQAMLDVGFIYPEEKP